MATPPVPVPTHTADTQPSGGPTVALFQKAHAKMVTLQRIDEQLSALLDQRKKLQDELRGVQALINDEFERLLEQGDRAPARMIAQVTEMAKAKKNGKPADAPLRLEVAS